MGLVHSLVNVHLHLFQVFLFNSNISFTFITYLRYDLSLAEDLQTLFQVVYLNDACFLV